MDLITVDFETYYDKDFSLRKMTTESYIRDPRFEVIGVGVKVNNGDTEWASGTHEDIKRYLHTFDWENSVLLAHNTLFDGAILSWLFDVHARIYTDTLCIARALHGVEVGGSLAALATRYGIGEKGTEVLDALGKRREDFTESELDKYGDYCVNDVELTYKLFNRMGKGFPKGELRLIDCTLRTFVEPILELDLGLLEHHLENTKQLKEDLITSSGATKKELMSNPKFAELLVGLDVIPPMKTSLTTGKQTYAFAKNDEQLKNSMLAPEGYMMVDCDSSQIEARVLAWLAGQDDLVLAFANGEDVYIKMSSKIYNVPEEQVTKEQRFVGKTTILGAGYGMGAVRFTEQLKSFGTAMDVEEARRVVAIYREANWKISHFWRLCQNMLIEMSRGNSGSFGPNGIVKYGSDERNGWVILPSGLKMRYDDLQYEQGERGPEFSYKTRRGRTRIYGGKVTENVCQAIARCIIGDQMLAIAKHYKVALTVHDSVVCCVPEDKLKEATDFIEGCMKTTPAWAEGLPITCESDSGKSYGEAAG